MTDPTNWSGDDQQRRRAGRRRRAGGGGPAAAPRRRPGLARAETDGPLSPAHALGLGAHIAACHALDLLPEPADPDGPEPVEADPVRALRAAEQLLRTHPIDAFPAGTSALVVSVGDLIAQATA